jgi:hypothetical protein
MEALRTQVPAVFRELPSSSHLLVPDALAWYRDNSRERADADKKAFDALISRADDGHREALTEVISHLFPVAQRFISNQWHDETASRRWRRARRVANAELFRLYFEVTLPQGVLPTFTVQAVVDALTDEERSRSLLDKLEPAQLRHLLDRLEDYQWEYRADAVEPALVALANQTPRVQATAEDSFGKSMGVGRVLLRLLRRIESEDERGEIVRRAFPRLNRLATQLHLVRLVGHEKGSGHGLVSENVEADLATQLRASVLAASAEELAEEDDLAQLLWWASDGDEKAVERVRAHAENQELFARLIESCISAAQSGAMGSVVVREEQTLPWPALEKLLEKDRLVRLVRVSALRVNDETLSKQTREAIGVALKYVEGWRPSIGWHRDPDVVDDESAATVPTAGKSEETEPASEGRDRRG